MPYAFSILQSQRELSMIGVNITFIVLIVLVLIFIIYGPIAAMWFALWFLATVWTAK